MSKSYSQFLTDTLKAFCGTFVYRESISFCENQTNNVSRTQTYGPGGQNGAADRATGHIRAPGPSVPSEPVALFTSTQKGLQWETSSPEGVQTLGFRRSYFQRLFSDQLNPSTGSVGLEVSGRSVGDIAMSLPAPFCPCCHDLSVERARTEIATDGVC